MGQVLSREELAIEIRSLKERGKKIVFTNGVFDILHRGHIEYLSKAKALGDILVVAVNTDSSVRRIKGEKRPVVPESDRSFVLANLAVVDYVCLFPEDTPYETIHMLRPNVLVKGSDYTIDKIVGRDIVEGDGGQVVTIEYLTGKSTTGIIQRIIEMNCS